MDLKKKLTKIFLLLDQPHIYHMTYLFTKPTEVVIEITNKCNLNCHNCFNKASFAKHNRNQKEMSTEYIKKIIDNIAKSNIKKVRFSGGEPFLRKDLPELINYAYNKNLTVWLNSNATNIPPDTIKKIENKVEDILISINGYNERSEKEWTSSNTFNQKIKTIKQLRKSKIPYLRAGTVATKSNIENLEKIYKIIKQTKLNSWEIYRPITLKKTNENLNINLLLTKLKNLSTDFDQIIPIANAIPLCANNPKTMNKFCVGSQFDDGHSRIVIDPTGYAKPSYFINENIGDPLNPIECWNHEFMKKMRNLKFLPQLCEGCTFIQKCKGGSRYIANLIENNYYAKDPLMNIKNLI